MRPALALLALALLLSAVVGIALGILLARKRWAQVTLRPLVLGLQALP